MILIVPCKERFEELIKWLLMLDLLEIPSSLKESSEDNKKFKKTELNKEIIKSSKIISEKYLELIKLAEESGYDLNKFNNKIEATVNKKMKPKITNKKRKTV